MFSAKDILEATEGGLLNGGIETGFSCISTDTRTINSGALFIAIQGPNFNGHDFVSKAKQAGAAGAVVSEGKTHLASEGDDFVIIKVNDTVKALGDIARFHRTRYDIPVIAITGSNGKTTTKEMLARLLTTKYKVLKNEGTENNFIGVPQTLLKLSKEHDVAVIELGTNHFGEISRLSDIVQPNCGVMLNAGPVHLEFFGSVDNVRKEKFDLMKRIGEDGSAIVNGDEAGFAESAKKMCDEVVTFGLSEGCDFRADDIREYGATLEFALNKTCRIKLNMLGRHNVYNALAAIAAASLYGVDIGQAAEALGGFVLPTLRMEYVESGGIRFIFDCYNSNPASLTSAIETFKNMDASKRRIIVAGDMLELGKAGANLHKEMGRLAARAGANILVGVGSLSRFILEGAREEGIGGNSLLHFENSADAATALKDILKEGDLVLVKGSRGMKMEEIKKCFTICSTR